jgi:hypothetical protein
LALVRGLTGPADYTPVVHSPRRVLLDVHLLCLPVLIYCPLQHLFFYSVADQLAVAPEYLRRVWGSIETLFRLRGRERCGSAAIQIRTLPSLDRQWRTAAGTFAQCVLQ